jgi:predicted transcriptional regulator
MSDKQAVMEALESMGPQMTFDDIVNELYVLARLRRGLSDAETGRVITNEEMKRRVAQWTSK